MLFNTPYVFLGVNHTGRDFAIGSLGGNLPTLRRLLDAASFDPLRDRLFSTGDLISSDVRSAECLWLAEQPWFIPVLGATEAYLQMAISKGRPALHPFHHWWTEQNEPMFLERSCEVLAQLPLAIEFSLPDGDNIGLTHAGISSRLHWDTIRTVVRRPKDLSDCVGRTVGSEVLWSSRAATSTRYRLRSQSPGWHLIDRLLAKSTAVDPTEVVRGIDLHISGAFPMVDGIPVHFSNRLFLDAAAGRPGGYLSLMEIGTSNCWLAATKQPSGSLHHIRIQPLFLDADGSVKPQPHFGERLFRLLNSPSPELITPAAAVRGQD